MYYQEIVSADVNFDTKTIVSVNPKFGFTLVPKHLTDCIYEFHIEEIVGKFEITKIAYDENFTKEVPFKKENNTFNFCKGSTTPTSKIYFDAKVEMKKVEYIEVWYHLQISPNDMKLLEIYDYYQRVLKMPDYDYIQFKCNIKKIAEGKIEVEIENPFDIRIQGKRGNHIFRAKDTDIIDVKLSVIFDPSIKVKLLQNEKKVENRTNVVNAVPVPLQFYPNTFSKTICY